MESRLESRQDSGIQARFRNPGESQGARGLVLSFGASECLMFYGYVYDEECGCFIVCIFYFIKDSRAGDLSRLVSSRLVSSRREGQGGLGLISGKGVFCVRNFFFPSTVTHIYPYGRKGRV